MRMPFRRRTPPMLPKSWAWAGNHGTLVRIRAVDLGAPVGRDLERRIVAELLAVHPSRIPPSSEAVFFTDKTEDEGAGSDVRVPGPDGTAPALQDGCVILARRPGRTAWDAIMAFGRRIEYGDRDIVTYTARIDVAYVSRRCFPSRIADAMVHAAVAQMRIDAGAVADWTKRSGRRPLLKAVLEAGSRTETAHKLLAAVSDGFETVFTVDLGYGGRIAVRTLFDDIETERDTFRRQHRVFLDADRRYDRGA